MTQESKTQETTTPALEPGELPTAALTQVAGGGDGPGSPGNDTGRSRL